jgi:RecA-family ATPase
VLEVKKANYSKSGQVLPLRWQDGAFVADIRIESALDRVAASAKAERVFLKLLRQYTSEGRYVSDCGPTYAPKAFADHPAAEGCRKPALKAAMDSLFQKGKLRMAKHGTGARVRTH